MSAEGPPSLPDELAARLRPERLLGRGSFGTVVLARDAAGNPAAVKLLDPQVAAHPQLRARFQREVRAGQALRSRHVVGLRDGGIAGDTAYLVLEFIDGQPLDEHLRARGARLPREEADDVLDQMLEGVADLHAAGLVHRDLKPANVLVEAGGRVVLADLGLVRGVADETLTKTGQLLGTPLYMPPEQMRGHPVGPGGDLYSLGAIYFEMLTGRPPFDGAELGDILAAKDAGLAAGLRAERVEVPAALDTLMKSWLSPDPARRPSDAAGLRRALEEARRAPAASADGTVAAPSPEADATRVAPPSVVASTPAVPVRALVGAPAEAPAVVPAPRGWVAGVLALGVALGIWWAGSATPSRPPLSPEGRGHLEVLAEGVTAPAIDDAVYLAGTDRTDAVVAAWKAGLDAFDELLRGTAARALAQEIVGVRLDAGEAEAVGKVLLRRRLLANFLDDTGAFALRASEVGSRFEEAYARVLRVVRFPALDLVTMGVDDDRPLEKNWTWTIHGQARREKERGVVDTLGGTWELVRTWDRDFQRYDFDHPTNVRPRLKKLAMSGEPFRDPSAEIPSLLQMARKSYHQALRDQDPERIEVAVSDPGSRPLVLAGTVARWNPTIQGVLTLVGAQEQVTLPFQVPLPGQGTAADSGLELHLGVLLHVDGAVLPAGLRALRIQAFGLQPIGTIDQVVQICELYQQRAGELPAPLRGGSGG
jgi:serine/threonine protein kinase